MLSTKPPRHRRALRSWIVLAGLALLGACAQDVETEHVDEGRACIEGGGQEVST